MPNFKRRKTSRKSRVTKLSPANDNLVNESLLRRAIELDVMIAELSEERAEIRGRIMESMDSQGVSSSRNDLATVVIIERDFASISATMIKKKAPKLYDEIEDGGFINKSRSRFCQIYARM